MDGAGQTTLLERGAQPDEFERRGLSGPKSAAPPVAALLDAPIL